MRSLKQININNILFLDIETVPQWQHFKDAPDFVRKEWIYKFKFSDKAPKDPSRMANINADQKFLKDKYENYFAELWERQAGLFAEFSKIVCISVGYFNSSKFRFTSFYDKNEGALLLRFKNVLGEFVAANKYLQLCGHYGKGFDYPFMSKRFLINRINLPPMLDTSGLKPWEISLLDTHELWKFGAYSGGGTLGSIAMAFGIPSPKDDIEGQDVSRCYYEGEIDRIVTYCEKDVITLAKVVQGMRGEELLKKENLEKIVI